MRTVQELATQVQETVREFKSDFVLRGLLRAATDLQEAVDEYDAHPHNLPVEIAEKLVALNPHLVAAMTLLQANVRK